MSKRPLQPGQPAQAPPLPPGPPPPNDPATQAAIQAAWQQYYAAQGGAQPGQPPTSIGGANSSSYANYGYGAGASMPGVSPSPASAGLVGVSNPSYASIAPVSAGGGGITPIPGNYGYPAGGATPYGQQSQPQQPYMGLAQQPMGYGQQPQYGQPHHIPGMGGMGMGGMGGMGMNMGMAVPNMGMYQQPQPGMGGMQLQPQQQPYGAHQPYGMQQPQQQSLIQPAGNPGLAVGQYNQQPGQHGPVQPHGLPSRPATGGIPSVLPGGHSAGPSGPRTNGPSQPQGPGNFGNRVGPAGPQINQPYHPTAPGGGGMGGNNNNTNRVQPQQQGGPPYPQVPGSRGPFDPRNNPIRTGEDFGPNGGGGPLKRQRMDGGPPPNLGIVPRDSAGSRPQVPGSRGPFDPRNGPPPARGGFSDEDRRAALEIREREPRDVRGGSDFGGSQHDGYRDGGREEYRSPRGGGARGARGGSGAYPRRESRDGGRYDDRRSGSGGGGDIDRGLGARGGGRGGQALRGGSRGGRGAGGSGAFPVRAGLPGSATGNGPPTGPKGRDTRILPKVNGVASLSASGKAASAAGPGGKGSLANGKTPSGPTKEVESDKVKEEKARETLRHRTLTDFKIVGLEIKALNWSWGQIRDHSTIEQEEGDGDASGNEEDEIEDGFGSEVEDDDEDDEASVRRVEEDRKSLPARPLKRERSFGESTDDAVREPKADSTEPPTKVLKTESDQDLAVVATSEEIPLEVETATETPQISRRASASETAEDMQASTDQADPPATPQSKLEPKTGEKRKAKMSSPDADDDVLLVSKKRLATESAVSRTPSKASTPSSSAAIPIVQNRFRIYFDSVVAPPEPSIEETIAPADDESVRPSENGAVDAPDDEAMAGNAAIEGGPDDTEAAAPKQEETADEVGDGDISMQGSNAPEDEEAPDTAIKAQEDALVAPTSDAVAVEVKVEIELGIEAEPTETSGDQAAVKQEQPSEHVAKKEDPSAVDTTATASATDATEADPAEASSSADAPPAQSQTPKVTEPVDDALDSEQHSEEGIALSEASAIDPAAPEESDHADTALAPEGIVLTEGTGLIDDAAPPAVSSLSTNESHESAPSKGPEAPVEGVTVKVDVDGDVIPASELEAPSAESIALAAEETARLAAAALQASAENAVAAYTQRAQRAVETSTSTPDASAAEFRRSPSLPPTSAATPLPSPSRLSILYDNGTRRLCVNSSLVERLQIHRKRGIIQANLRLSIAGAQQRRNKAVEGISQKTEEIDVQAAGSEEHKDEAMEGDAPTATDEKAVSTLTELAKPVWELTDGLMLELLDQTSGTFTQLSGDALRAIWAVDPDAEPTADEAFPPLHTLVAGMIPGESVKLTAYLDQERSLTEAKWVKTGQVEDWIRSGSKVGFRRNETVLPDSWTGKIDVIDPEAPVNLVNVLDLWAEASKLGAIKERRRFVQTHLMLGTNPLQILLRLVRGSEPVLTRTSIPHLFSPLDKAIDLHAAYADKQSISTLAVLSIANLTREFAVKAGETAGAADKKMADVVKALPNKLLFPVCDELFVEWAKSNQKIGVAKKGGKR